MDCHAQRWVDEFLRTCTSLSSREESLICLDRSLRVLKLLLDLEERLLFILILLLSLQACMGSLAAIPQVHNLEQQVSSSSR